MGRTAFRVSSDTIVFRIVQNALKAWVLSRSKSITHNENVDYLSIAKDSWNEPRPNESSPAFSVNRTLLIASGSHCDRSCRVSNVRRERENLYPFAVGLEIFVSAPHRSQGIAALLVSVQVIFRSNASAILAHGRVRWVFVSFVLIRRVRPQFGWSLFGVALALAEISDVYVRRVVITCASSSSSSCCALLINIRIRNTELDRWNESSNLAGRICISILKFRTKALRPRDTKI